MNRERAQSLVEAVAAVPVCVACALTIVDAGVLVRDRIATTQAATRAAEAHLSGRDGLDAARDALPDSLHDSVELDVADDRLVLRASSDTMLTRLARRPVEHRSSVALAVEDAR